MQINIPQAVSEVTEAFHAYEAALNANDVPTLQNFFWDSPLATRFGFAEQLYGYESICAYRRDRVINFTQRESKHLAVTTFGKDFASVMYEYTALIDGIPRHGRQSQTWSKVGPAWKIVAAHISILPDADQSFSQVKDSLAALGLKPKADWLPRIAANFQTTSTLAGTLMDFPLPPQAEPAPVFSA